MVEKLESGIFLPDSKNDQILTNLAEKKKFFQAKSPKKPVLKVQSLITSFDQGKATKSGHHSPSSRLLEGENEVRLISSGECDRKLKLNSPKLNKSVLKHIYSKKKKFGASYCQKTKTTTYFEKTKCPTENENHWVGDQTNQGGAGQL